MSRAARKLPPLAPWAEDDLIGAADPHSYRAGVRSPKAGKWIWFAQVSNADDPKTRHKATGSAVGRAEARVCAESAVCVLLLLVRIEDGAPGVQYIVDDRAHTIGGG